jgi:hypothetical protein
LALSVFSAHRRALRRTATATALPNVLTSPAGGQAACGVCYLQGMVLVGRIHGEEQILFGVVKVFGGEGPIDGRHLGGESSENLLNPAPHHRRSKSAWRNL